MLVAIKRHELARLRVAAHAVFGAVERGDFHVGVRAKFFDDAHEVARDAGGVRDQADALVPQEAGVFLKQDVDPELHFSPA